MDFIFRLYWLVSPLSLVVKISFPATETLVKLTGSSEPFIGKLGKPQIFEVANPNPVVDKLHWFYEIEQCKDTELGYCSRSLCHLLRSSSHLSSLTHRECHVCIAIYSGYCFKCEVWEAIESMRSDIYLQLH
jgi:hypothetical protein